MLRWLSLCLVLFTSGCGFPLHVALWHDEVPVHPRHATTEVRCEVHESRGQITDNAGDTCVAIELVPVDDTHGVKHARRWSHDRRGHLHLRPRPSTRTWFFGAAAELRQPRSWDVKVYGGSRVGGSTGTNARVTIRGRAPIEVFGCADDREETNDEPFRPFVLGPQWERDALLGVDVHDWSHLLGGARSTTCVPVAWIDRRGESHPRASDRSRADDYDLVLECAHADGPPTRWRIPGSILASTFDQELRRSGSVIAWTYSDVWTGRHRRAGEYEPLSFPLESATITYEWSYAQPYEGPSFLWNAARVLATPFAVTIDFLASTNPSIARFLHWLLGPAPTVTPNRGRK